MKVIIRPETEMKNSGIEWMGNIPKDWDITKLGNLGEIQTGNTPDKSNSKYYSNENGVLWVKAENLGTIYPIEETSEYITEAGIGLARIFDKNTVFVCCIASIGKCGYSNKRSSCNQQINGISFDKLFWKYGLYMTIAQEEEYLVSANGNVVKILNTNKQKMIKCPMPPLSEQQAIADYLDETCSKIDEIIAEAKASIDEYKNLREAVISNATTRGIKKNRCMKSSGVEWVLEIPSDWDMIPAKVLFSQSNERKHVDDVQLTASQKYGIISQVEYMKRENSRIVIATQGIENWKHVEPNDFIISLRSFQGGLEKSDVSGCITWHYVVLKANNGVYYNYFKWLFKSDKYINALQGTCNFIRDGQDLRFSNFVQVPLLAVPIEEQKEIADYLNKKVPKIDSLIAEKESLINDLEAYKKSLIYEVVTGKRKVV